MAIVSPKLMGVEQGCANRIIHGVTSICPICDAARYGIRYRELAMWWGQLMAYSCCTVTSTGLFLLSLDLVVLSLLKISNF